MTGLSTKNYSSVLLRWTVLSGKKEVGHMLKSEQTLRRGKLRGRFCISTIANTGNSRSVILKVNKKFGSMPTFTKTIIVCYLKRHMHDSIRNDRRMILYEMAGLLLYVCISTRSTTSSLPSFVVSVFGSVTILIISGFEQTSLRHHSRKTSPDSTL